MYRGYRCSSVPRGLYGSGSLMNVNQSAASMSTARLPTYCPPHGQYYGYSVYSTPVTSTKIYTPSVSSARHFDSSPSYSLSSKRYFENTQPMRRLGTRLSRGYAATTMTRPEIYEQAYGVSHLADLGRNSFSAYKIADATIDDSDDMVSTSYKRDNQVLKDVERYIATVSDVPPLRRPMIRASSVPPLFYRAPMVKSSKVSTHAVRRPGAAVNKHSKRVDHRTYFKVPQSKVHYNYETVGRGSELLSAKERMYAREAIDLASPSGTLSLRMRIHDVQNALHKQGAMLNKYSIGPDADDIEVNAELRRIKTSQALRAKSVV